MRYFNKLITGVALFAFATLLQAQTASEIDSATDKALQQFHKEIKGSKTFSEKNVKGLLIFPSVVKAGIGIGGEYGEGVLRIDGNSTEYYSTASASIGLQFGIQKKSIIIAFLSDDALKSFSNSAGWEVGVDGSIALINWGAGKDISQATFNKPVIGFVFGSKGLMYNLTIEGSKFTKIVR